MTLADKVTASRLILAPAFFVIYLCFKDAWTVTALWSIFILAEISDLLDGQIARRRRESSAFGKLFDPFADTLVRVTYFLLFTMDGILPVAGLAIVLWREFGILFLRNLMLRKGVTMGARWGGKVKAVAYMLAGVFALLASSVRRLGHPELLFSTFRFTAIVVYAASIVLALLSFADYLREYRKADHEGGEGGTIGMH